MAMSQNLRDLRYLFGVERYLFGVERYLFGVDYPPKVVKRLLGSAGVPVAGGGHGGQKEIGHSTGGFF